MTHKSIGILTAFFTGFILIWTACDSVTPETPTVEQTSQFSLKGSINTSFESINPQFDGKVKIIEFNDGYELAVVLSVKGSAGKLKESANIKFKFHFESTNGVLPIGNYTISENSGYLLGNCNYQFLESEDDFLRFRLTGKSLLLDIDSSSSNKIKGRFRFEMNPEICQQMKNGVLENIDLAGTVLAQGKFELEIEK